MSYAFSPISNSLDRSYAFWNGGYSRSDIDRIVELCSSLPKVPGQVGNRENNVDAKMRDSHIAWLPFPHEDDRFRWIYERVAAQVIKTNAQFFKFDLWGFVDRLQYTVYDAANGDQHYDWHVDITGKSGPPRKLSLTLQLCDPMEYEGGELWLHGVNKVNLPKERGLMHLFPSYTLHRVTPVTQGLRRSLVGWVAGPEFR